MASDKNIGIHRKIIQNDAAVHRPAHYWTGSVHGLLRYLESVGFTYAPRVLGFDEQGREMLSFIEGESGAKGWEKILSDEGLSKYAKLLRRYHDAVAGYVPAADSEWAYGHNQLEPGEIICHGDFGPWNIVWRGDEPVGIIDWDMARPAKPEFDILYALEYAVPFDTDEKAVEWNHFTEAPDRKHRIAVFLDAYGAGPIPDIAAKVAAMQREVNTGAKTIAARGIEPQAGWGKDGTLAQIDAKANWVEKNRTLFQD